MTETAVKPDVEPDIDRELLEEAQAELGTTSRNATINGVLRAYVEAKRDVRRQALADLRRMSDEGAFDYSALEAADQ